MGNPTVITYDVPNPTLFAAVQNVTAPNGLILKGSSPYAQIPTGPLTVGNYERYVSITSTDNINTAVFTITGYRLGSQLAVTTTVTNVNANTQYSSVPFQTILSIVPSITVTNVSAGTGRGANYNWITMNTYCPFAQYSVQGIVGAEGGQTISYTVNITLETLNQPYNLITGFPISAGFTAATTNQFAAFQIPATGIQLVVNQSGTTNESMGFLFLQQGLRS